MLVILLPVDVKVAMGLFAVVAMGVRVQLQSSFASQGPQDVKTEDYEHGSDRHLQPESDLLWYRDLEQQYGHANRKKRGGVTEPPECSDQRRTSDALMLAHYGRYCHHVIGVERVPQSVNES